MLPTAKRNFFKLRVALFFGYNGKNYRGSQSQKDQSVSTVEKAVFEGLIDSKLISETHMGELKKAGWGRGARTDKGVHALSNGVSVKLAISEEYLLPGSPVHLPEELPIIPEEEVKPIDLNAMTTERVPTENTNEVTDVPSQNAEESQEGKTEEQIAEELRQKKHKEYMKFAEANRQKKLQKRMSEQKKQEFAEDRRRLVDVDKIIGHLNGSLPSDVRAITIKQVTRKFDIRMHCKYRVYEYLMPLFVYQKYEDLVANTPISEEQEAQILARVAHLANKFKGTHNFHNYTRAMKAKDARCMRYILDMQTNLVVNETTKQKFIRITLTGQSFIYHQIRKMMGIIAQIVSEDLPESVMDSSFFHNVTRVWLAPAHGLFLNRMRFDGYNKKEGVPELIEFDEKEEGRMTDIRKIIETAIMEDNETNTIYRQWLKDIKEGKDEAVEGDNESISGDFADG